MNRSAGCRGPAPIRRTGNLDTSRQRNGPSRDQLAQPGIGFDDAWIYAEIPKAPEVRSLPMAHLPLPEAAELFREWETKADKVPY